MSDPIVPVVPTPAPVVEPTALPPGVPSTSAPPRLPDTPITPAAVIPPVDSDSEEFDIGTGNTALDTAITAFVSVTGAKPADLDRAVAKAMEYGNPDLIDRAFIKEKFGKFADQALSLAEAAVKEDVRVQQENITKNKQTVYTAAGGEQQWNQAVSVFNTSATPTIKAAVKALMDQGNIAGGAELLLNSVKDSGLLPNVNPTLQGGGAVSGAAGALTASQFQAELATLRTEAGNRSFETGPVATKYNSLIARRAAGKKLGI
ncbi:hypothetical protein [Sphingobium sp. CFD-1]|uniref:hypothetical protein n=1 Tax=Sphingobium sp. CFD-1 TaxID=2878545 RepID=UPI00214C113C|nr:hypothetical protein [Sphingobium sp. CFD-1]